MDAKDVFSKAPLLARTTFKHYTAGPPQKSWNISFHLIFVLIKTFIIEASLLPVEVVQKRSGHPAMFSTSVVIDQFFIPQSYHQTAQKYLEKILKPYEAALDDEWKDTYNGIGGEWVYEKNRHPAKRVVLYLHGGAYYLGSAGSQRPLTSNLAKAANAKVLAINYRLAPQNQFPAALHDALAAYLYLLEPPEDAGFEAYKPEEIVISGDSAGGGLTLATCLAIRDAGLPTPAGAVGYSPWLDLTHSMPSVLSPSCQETDYLPDALIRHPPSPALERSEKRARALSAKIKKMGNLGFKFDERITEIDEKIHLYAPNEALWIPYVSPLLAEDLSGLPPLLIQTGHGERIRDESILFAFKLGNPQNVGVGNSDKSTGVGNRGEVTLEVYDDMPHVFQMFSIWKPAKTAFTSTGNFIRRVTDPNNVDSSVFNAFRVTVDGKFLPLNEDEYRNVLNWDRVGKLPQLQNVDRISLKPTSKTEIDIWPTVANMAFFFALISLFFWTT